MRLHLLLLPILAACTAEQPQSTDQAQQEARIDAQAPPLSGEDGLPSPPPPPPPAPSALPGLLPLSEAQIVQALGSGASCALSDGGAPVMVAVPGAAIANDGGRIVRLGAEAADWAALLEGGTFTAESLKLEIDAGATVERRGEVTVYDASVSLWRGRRGFSTSHGPRWSCGS